MSSRTMKGAVNAYLKKYASALEGQDVIIVALKLVAASLDEHVNASLMAEYRRLHSILEAHRLQDVNPNSDDQDDLLGPA